VCSTTRWCGAPGGAKIGRRDIDAAQKRRKFLEIRFVEAGPFTDQRPGTSGLRKKTRVFEQAHYLETFVQAVLEAAAVPRGATLVLGGDGRYLNDRAVQTIVRVAAGNGVGRLIVGRDGLLSTPAASHLIRSRGAHGGIILSASHNPGGPDGDFGIKYNGQNGGPAPEALTERIFETASKLKGYRLADLGPVPVGEPGRRDLGGLVVEVVDPVADYLALMERLFDLDRIAAMFASGFRMRFDAMGAVTGPYAKTVLEGRLGAAPGTVVNGDPLPDFGGHHPDPNPAHAKELLAEMADADGPDFGAASDGDGDRNMIVGRGLYVSPGDSLAVLLANADLAPGYRGRVAGVARSLVTSRAVDRVADAMRLPCYQTPTGWKFFGNLLDAGLITFCGEESFGTGSDHVREKDGLWAVLFWLNVVAATGKSVSELLADHWARFGRDYFTRHDYEGLDPEVAAEVVGRVVERCAGGEKELAALGVDRAYEFEYVDPVDGSVSRNQGYCFEAGEARVLFRLSGTGTEGATLRCYVERYERRPDRLHLDAQTALADDIALARDLAGLDALRIGAPTTIT